MKEKTEVIMYGMLMFITSLLVIELAIYLPIVIYDFTEEKNVDKIKNECINKQESKSNCTDCCLKKATTTNNMIWCNTKCQNRKEK